MRTTPVIYEGVTAEVLQELEVMAGLFFGVKEIAITLGWNSDQLEQFELTLEIMDVDDPLYCAYYKGRIAAEVELRQAIKQAAKNGSNPAQITMLNFQLNSK